MKDRRRLSTDEFNRIHLFAELGAMVGLIAILAVLVIAFKAWNP